MTKMTRYPSKARAEKAANRAFKTRQVRLSVLKMLVKK